MVKSSLKTGEIRHDVLKNIEMKTILNIYINEKIYIDFVELCFFNFRELYTK